MVFNVGKYYKHTAGTMIHIIGAAKTTLYGWTLLAEEAGYGNFKPIGQDESSAVNWMETTKEDWMSNFS